MSILESKISSRLILLASVMSSARIPVWKTRPKPKLPRYGFFLPLIAAICALGLQVRFAARLTDGELFYMKLASFAVTATLGIIGIVTDFKDQQKKLTPAGRLNLAGLLFAAAVGIVAQKAEFDHARASAQEQAQNARREAKNQVVGDIIELRFQTRIPLDGPKGKILATFLKKTSEDILDKSPKAVGHFTFIDKYTELDRPDKEITARFVLALRYILTIQFSAVVYLGRLTHSQYIQRNRLLLTQSLAFLNPRPKQRGSRLSARRSQPRRRNTGQHTTI